MKLLEFIEKNKIDGFEIIPNKIINDILIPGTIMNIISDNKPYGIKVNTSKIESGTILETVTDYTITNNILLINDLTLDLENIYMLNTK